MYSLHPVSYTHLDFIQIFASNVRRLDFRLSSAQVILAVIAGYRRHRTIKMCIRDRLDGLIFRSNHEPDGPYQFVMGKHPVFFGVFCLLYFLAVVFTGLLLAAAPGQGGEGVFENLFKAQELQNAEVHAGVEAERCV